MDLLSHILIGAAAGQIIARKKKGNKALYWGIFASVVPDLDVIFQNLFSPVNSLLFHRGISHSILFFVLFSPLLAFLITKIHKDNKSDFVWYKLVLVAWASHLFVDVFNSYGTGILLPFSEVRVSFDSINVVDVTFTLPLLVSFLFYAFRKNINKGKVIACAGLIFSSVYFLATIGNKIYIENEIEKQLNAKNINALRVLTSPLPMSNLAWMVNTEMADGFYTGVYYQVADNDVKFDFVPKNKRFKEDYEGFEDFRKLEKFTKNWYALDSVGVNNIVMYDLRFSALTGKEKFALKLNLTRTANGMQVSRVRPNRNINFNCVATYWVQIFSDQPPS